MSNSLNLYRVVCPSCKELTYALTPYGQDVVCPRCNVMQQNPTVTTIPADSPRRYIPFSTTEADFVKTLHVELEKQKLLPDDVFNVIRTDHVYRIYLPMFLYEGAYQMAWTCEEQVKQSEVKVSGNKVKSVEAKRWTPRNGNASNSFSTLCVANDVKSDIPESLREFASQFTYDASKAQPFSTDVLQDEQRLVSIPLHADTQTVWKKQGLKLLEAEAERVAREQIGEDTKMRKLKVKTEAQLANKGEYILVPFWFVFYTYAGKRYYFMMDGTGAKNAYTYPEDKKKKSAVRKLKLLRSNFPGILFIPLLVYYLEIWNGSLQFSWGYAIAFFLAWAVISFAVTKIIGKKIADKQKFKGNQE